MPGRGRPKKYANTDERMEAFRLSQKRYYTVNRDAILARRRRRREGNLVTDAKVNEGNRKDINKRDQAASEHTNEKCWAEIQAFNREFQEMTRGASQDYTECLVCQAIAKDTTIAIEEALKRVSILKRRVSTLLDDILENNGCGKLWSKGHIIYLNLQVFVQRLENILGFALGGINDLQRKYRSKRLMYQN
ncbi:hypothetical protein BDN71DRAFT_1507577 [Pleurotus eryngii]|uniref:Uncharacterized protein n=1 Tax=Pleurotus eryngii TaxID=5323 RepID=A0A9P5ZV67_PLEER|nr:hypothetical protein BDN71DRAFT_1507577 [Pleurotus eryngii]